MRHVRTVGIILALSRCAAAASAALAQVQQERDFGAEGP